MLRAHAGDRLLMRPSRRRVLRYLRTKLATDWTTESRAVRVARWLLTRVIPEANPDYRFDEVREWLVEFDDDGRPCREIGLDGGGGVVLAGPDERNHGFWLDTDMRFEDFGGEEIDAAGFEEVWGRWLEGRA